MLSMELRSLLYPLATVVVNTMATNESGAVVGRNIPGGKLSTRTGNTDLLGIKPIIRWSRLE
jgi:hypothetical protein